MKADHPSPSPIVDHSRRRRASAQTGVRLALAVLVALLAGPARAEVTQASADSLLLAFSQPLAAAPQKVYDALPRVRRWWSSDHTYSGSAANLSLRAEAGGCFCEHWKGGSGQHGTVIVAMRNQMLRLRTALGPLQAKGVTGILTFQITPNGNGSLLTTTYVVNGTAESALDKVAPTVDRVLGEQLARLARFIQTGSVNGR